MSDILCSIIIPTFNGEAYIGKTIQSCLSQTLINNIEIIVVDDDSSDQSAEIVQNLSDCYLNIKFLKNESNLGINKSLNRALCFAEGLYVCFLGQDDILPPMHIELLVSEFDDSTCFVHCNSDLIDERDNVIKLAVNDTLQVHRSKFIKYYLAISNVVHSTGALVKTTCLLKVGGWSEEYKNYGEWLMWVNLIHCGVVKYSLKSKALYRRHQTNVTNSFKSDSIRPELFAYHKMCRKVALQHIDNIGLRILLICFSFFRQVVKREII
jgi:glycosyltransferase involved in cell wall biosynthesis